MYLFRFRLRLHPRVFQTIFIAALVFTALTIQILILSPQSVQAAGITVNSLADATVAGNSACTLREAINNANNNSDSTGGDCPAGSGADTITFNVNGTITLGSTLPDITSAMTIDGTGQTVAVSGNNTVKVFHIAAGGNLTLNSLTIQNGNAGPFYGNRGGAVFNELGALIATNVTFSGNTANQGGAIYSDYTSTLTTLTNSTFTGNSGDEGAAVYAFNTLITMTNDVFTSNSATYGGGALYNWGTMNVSGSTFTGNSASTNGGGIYNYGTITITNSTLSGNTSASGGGFYNYSSTVTVNNSTISGNTATGSGGGTYSSYGTTTVTNSTISGNTSGANGGAFYINGTDLTLTADTISGNSAVTGGGMFRDSSIVGETRLAGNIFDTGASGANCVTFNTWDMGYNISDDASCNFDFYSGSRSNAALNLSALGFNEGGSTKTHAPGAGSAAIAVIPYGTTINNNGVTLACNASSVDQNNISHPRIANGSCSSGAAEAAEAVITCSSPANITTAPQLNACLIWSNAYPGADTFTLGANITLSGELTYILSGVTINGGGHFISGNNAVRVLRVAATGTVTLDSIFVQNGSATEGGGISNSGVLTISNSTVSNNTSTNNGAGINNQGTLTISNSTLSGNSTTTTYFGGGAIYNMGPLTISNTTISGNTSASRGAGIYNDYDYVYSTGGSVTMTDSSISNNTATDWGGGLYTRGGTTDLTSTPFTNNTSSTNGGGIYGGYGATLIVNDGTFSGNSATNNGGAIYTENGHILTINDTSFSGNSSTYGGAILAFGTTTVTNSTLNNNSATTSGGGIYNGGTATLSNTTLSTNSATYGGAIFSDGTTTVTQSTISGNTGTTYGGGIFGYSGGTYLAGVLLHKGSSGENCIVQLGSFYDNFYNLSDDTNCGFFQPGSANNISLQLGSLQNNGGPTRTILPNLGSPALDRIPNGTAISNNGTSYVCNQNAQPLDTDQRGEPRPSILSGKCDVGAVEVNFDFSAQKPVLVSPTNGNSGSVNPLKLVWNGVPTATSYIIQLDTANPPGITIATVSGTTYTLPSAIAVGTYYWRVRAVNAVNDLSDWSNIFSFTLVSPDNGAPSNNYQATSTPTLTWNRVSGATEYEIQVDNTPAFNTTLEFTTTVPASSLYVTTDPLLDGTYYWHVRARQADGKWGAWSVTQSFLVDAP